MLNYVNTVLVSNLASSNIFEPTELNHYMPKAATSMASASDDAGKFIIMNCDPNVGSNEIYDVTAGNALNIDTIKVGIITKKNTVLRNQDGSVTYTPIVKWSNEIKAADIKSFNFLEYTDDTEDCVYINFTSLDSDVIKAHNRIVIRLTYKDMPHRYRKWTESYEYTVQADDTKAKIVSNIANMINREWKRARVQAIVGSINTTLASNNGTLVVDGSTKYFHTDSNFGTSSATTGTVLQIVALPYDDDDSVDSLNWANKVRFNANIYYTDPEADGWESKNKYFPKGVAIVKVPGKQYAASAKLVRDRESWAMGYQGILNRGEGTWPIIKPAMETDLDAHYDGITLEFENMYRAADDIQRKTKQTLEVYGKTGQLAGLKNILASFVSGTSSSADAGQDTKIDKIKTYIQALVSENAGVNAPAEATLPA